LGWLRRGVGELIRQAGLHVMELLMEEETRTLDCELAGCLAAGELSQAAVWRWTRAVTFNGIPGVPHAPRGEVIENQIGSPSHGNVDLLRDHRYDCFARFGIAERPEGARLDAGFSASGGESVAGWRWLVLQVSRFAVGIPAKANTDSSGNANGIPGRRRTVVGA
jgi:hypothetical protein